MQVNALKKITGLLIAMILVIGTWPPVMADDPPPPKPPEAIRECLDEYPEFQKDKPFTFPKEKLDTPLKFRVAFEAARNQYHEFVECVFNKAWDQIMTVVPRSADLNNPRVACLDAQELLEVANNTGSTGLLGPLLKAYNAYSEYLMSLFQISGSHVVLEGRFEKAAAQVNKMENLVNNEIQDALVAIDTSLRKLMELRQVFVMHIHFQCMLLHLEDYRTLLGELRKVTVLLPTKLIDAAMSK
ncbi:MAG: hypothetical protein V1760_03325 [Candidatus Peregrinibacteria bacterium]